jgi:hypothetical protein
MCRNPLAITCNDKSVQTPITICVHLRAFAVNSFFLLLAGRYGRVDVGGAAMQSHAANATQPRANVSIDETARRAKKIKRLRSSSTRPTMTTSWAQLQADCIDAKRLNWERRMDACFRRHDG